MLASVSRNIQYLKSGAPGKDAVVYDIAFSATNYIYDRNGALKTDALPCTFYRTTGSTREVVKMWCEMLWYNASGTVIQQRGPYQVSSIGSWGVPAGTAKLEVRLYDVQPVNAAALDDYVYRASVGVLSDSKALVGPLDWASLPLGYAFQSGGPADSFVHVVRYNNYYYVCRNNHSKTADNYPTSTNDNNNSFWGAGISSWPLVATKILLAEYAVVENLGVRSVEMKNGAGEVVFRAKDGAVSCKTGIFENVTVNSATINDANCNRGTFNDILFSGIMQRKKTVINDSNIADYATLNAGMYIINTNKGVSWYEINTSGTTTSIIELPWHMTGNTDTAKRELARSIVGNSITLYNRRAALIYVHGAIDVALPSNTVQNTFFSSGIASMYCAQFTCKLGICNGEECIYWAREAYALFS